METIEKEIHEFLIQNGLYGVGTDIRQHRLEIEEYRSSIRRFKGTLIWKLAWPARMVYHFFHRRMECYRKYGIRGIFSNQIELSKRAKKRFARQYINGILPSPDQIRRQKNRKFKRNVKFSILVPLYNTPMAYLREMIESVQKQTYANWELCLADGSDSDHRAVEAFCLKRSIEDERIIYRKLKKNRGISENTNVCIHMATGDYICLFDHDDVLHPSVLYELMKAICKSGADFLYTDEGVFSKDDLTNIGTYHFKPDFAPDNLIANNYIAHLTCFDQGLLKITGGFRKEYDGSQDHDMILRLTSVANNIVHIPKLLYFWRSHPSSVASALGSKTYAIQAGRNAVKDFLSSQGIEAEVESSKAFPVIYRIKYQLIGKPAISIIIPNRNDLAELALCIDSILKRTSYAHYEIIVIENHSSSAKIWEYYRLIMKMPNIKVIEWKSSFNYSKMNNFGASQSSGEYLLFLSKDTEVVRPDWIQELLMFAQRKDVGAVGGKLHFGDGAIQHAGLVLGLGEDRIAGYSHLGEEPKFLGYMGKLHYAQDVSAVSGACLMVSKEKFEEVGGFDENLASSYLDVDFCLKLREKAYLNIFTPEAVLYHHVYKPRSYGNKGKRWERFNHEADYMKKKWDSVLEKGDPYYNPNFSLKVSWKIKGEA